MRASISPLGELMSESKRRKDLSPAGRKPVISSNRPPSETAPQSTSNTPEIGGVLAGSFFWLHQDWRTIRPISRERFCPYDAWLDRIADGRDES